MVKGASVVVPLPVGKLGLSFVGKNGNVVVADVKENGAMYGRSVKPGYIVSSIIIGDKEETFTDKHELTRIISENSGDATRKLRCQIAYKAEIEVTVPFSMNNGSFAIATRKGLPCISKIDSTCTPLKAKASVGMIVNKVTVGGYSMIGYDSDAINSLLLDSATREPITLTLLAPKSTSLSERSIKYESNKVVELPTFASSLLTISDSTSIPKIDVGTSVKGILPGMVVQAVRIPNGTQYDDLSAALLMKVLAETDDIEGRLINLVPSDYYDKKVVEAPTLKVYPPALGGSMAELGFCCEESSTGSLVVSKVEEYSDLAGIFKGLKLLEVTYEEADGTIRTATPSSLGELDTLLSKSSGCDRYIVFGNLSVALGTGITIQLEPGKLGLTFKGSPAELSGIKETSQILGKGYDVVTGMAVSEAVIGGQKLIRPSTKILTSTLIANATSSDRVITFEGTKGSVELREKFHYDRDDKTRTYKCDVSIPRVTRTSVHGEFDAIDPERLPRGALIHGAKELRAAGLTGKGVKIAVIDSGIDENHPGFHGMVKRKRWYMTGSLDKHDHGTHVAGTIHFMAPDAEIHDYRVFGTNQGINGNLAIAKSIIAAVDDNCDIINMSLRVGYPVWSEVTRAVEYAYSKGVHMVCAAGNYGDGNPDTTEKYSYPARFLSTISVGAVMKEKGLPATHFSESNEQVTFSGIGMNVISLKPYGGFRKMSGTSMASPHVAGFIACLLSGLKNKISDKDLRELIKTEHLVDIGRKGFDTQTGFGFVVYNKGDKNETIAETLTLDEDFLEK